MPVHEEQWDHRAPCCIHRSHKTTSDLGLSTLMTRRGSMFGYAGFTTHRYGSSARDPRRTNMDHSHSPRYCTNTGKKEYLEPKE